MTVRTGRLLSALVVVVGAIALAMSVYAQSSSPSEQGSSVSSGRDSSSSSDMTGAAEAGAKQAYHATVNEIGDAALTTKVKTALLSDKTTRHYTIHVNSEKGTVTISGDVPSTKMAQRVQDVVQSVKGVKIVRNELHIAPATSG